MAEAAEKYREEHDQLFTELTTPERTKSVCEVCGVFVNSTDNEQRRLVRIHLEHPASQARVNCSCVGRFPCHSVPISPPRISLTGISHGNSLPRLYKGCCTPGSQQSVALGLAVIGLEFVMQDHINGKQYVGWKKIRDKLTDLEERFARGGGPPPPDAGVDRAADAGDADRHHRRSEDRHMDHRGSHERGHDDRRHGYGHGDRGYGDRERGYGDRSYSERERGYGDRGDRSGYSSRERYGDRYGGRGDRGYGGDDRYGGRGHESRGYDNRAYESRGYDNSRGYASRDGVCSLQSCSGFMGDFQMVDCTECCPILFT